MAFCIFFAQVWAVETGAEVASLHGHTSCITSACFSPDGRSIASSSGDGTVRVWDAPPVAPSRLAAKEEEEEGGSSLAPAAAAAAATKKKGTAAAAGGKKGKEASGGATKPGGGDASKKKKAPSAGAAPAGGGAKKKKGSGGDSGATSARPPPGPTPQEAERARAVAPHTHRVTSCAFSPDGTRVVSASWDATVKIWDAATGLVAATHAHLHRNTVTACAFSPDGASVVSSCSDSQLKLWAADTGAVRWCERPSWTYRRTAFTPDGQFVVAGAPGGGRVNPSLCLRAASDGAPRFTFPAGHRDLAISPDGSRIVTCWGVFQQLGSAPKSSAAADDPGGVLALRVYEVSALLAAGPGTPGVLGGGAPTPPVPIPAASVACLGHTGSVTACAWTPNGGAVASGGSDLTLRLWDPRSGACLSVTPMGSALIHIRPLPGTDILVSSSDAQEIDFWHCGPRLPVAAATQGTAAAAVAGSSGSQAKGPSSDAAAAVAVTQVATFFSAGPVECLAAVALAPRRGDSSVPGSAAFRVAFSAMQGGPLGVVSVVEVPHQAVAGWPARARARTAAEG